MGFIGKLYRRGNLLYVKGSPRPMRLVFVEQFGFSHYFNDEIFKWIEILAETGVNGMRVFGFWPFGKGGEEEPYVKVGDTYDLRRFNERYFDYLKRWIQYAQQKGILVLYELFDSSGFWNAEYAPYNPFYELTGSNHLKFSNLSNYSLIDIQQRYIRKVIETITPLHENVFFGIMNEYKGKRDWHAMISRYIKKLAPDALTAGSEEDSEAVIDPYTDLWFIHTGTYNISTGQSNTRKDAFRMRSQAGNNKVLGFSTDGFMPQGMKWENPDDMSRLAQDVIKAGLPIFSFLDQKAYPPQDQAWSARSSRLNIATYRAIVKKFRPTVVREPEPEFSEGILDVFKVARLPSTHKGAFVERGGKAIRFSKEHGFLCYGQYKTGYPQTPLKAVFSILIDDNTSDDRNILILDVYDHHSDRVIGKRVITRKDFPKADDFSLFDFDFIPPSAFANMEFRIYYMGWAYILADKITVLEPANVSTVSLREALE